MPLDHYDEDEEKAMSNSGSVTEFDCPECSANNQLEKALTDGQELFCNYCGCEFLVKALDNGRFKFREV